MSQVSVAHRLAYIAVGIVLGSVLASTQPGRSRAPSEKAASKSLPGSLGSLRLTEGRMADQLAYAPYPTSFNWQTADKALLAELARQLNDSTTPRDRAMMLLAHGQLDAAISELEVALQLSPGDAALLSDLSALYGERAQGRPQPERPGSTSRYRGKAVAASWAFLIKSPEDFVTALELAEKAASLDPSLPAAAFNQAVALEHLFLDQQASEAWRRYLQLDGTSSWAGEARQRIYRLDHALPYPDLKEQMLAAVERGYQGTIIRSTGDHQTAREIFEEDLLYRWADAIGGKDQERAEILLESARDIADQFAFTQGGDRIFQKIVFEMGEITSLRGSLQTSSALLRYLQLQARSGTSDSSTAGTAAALEDAAKALEATSSPLGMLVRFRRAERLSQQREDVVASSELLELGKDSRLADYPSLEARQQSLAGLIAQRQEALTDAMAAYRRAIELYDRVGELPNAAATRTQLATCLEALGQPSEAWKYRYQALAWSRRRPARDRLPTVAELLETGVGAALSQRRPKVALRLQMQLVRTTYALNDPEKIVRALLGCARIKAGLASNEQARRDFNQALEELQRVPLSAREKLAAQIDVTRADIEASDDRLGKIAWELGDPDQLTAQADFYFERGNTAVAEEYLRRALDDLERRRAKVDSDEWEYQVSFLDQSRPLYNRMVALQLHLGKPRQALETLERFRARVLLDRWRRLSDEAAADQLESRLATPLSWQEISRRVPTGTVIVVYGVVEERLVTWMLRRGKIELIPQQTAWVNVASLVDSLNRHQTTRTKQSLLSLLYQQLVAPWRNQLAPGERLIFVPERSLYDVPFAALFDRQSGRFLIQDHALGVAPSASEFLSAIERERQLSSRPLREVLLVSDPLEDDSSFPSLPGAKEEIALLKKVYASLKLHSLARSEATPGRVMSGLGRADVAHFSVHGLGDRADPNRAFLKLSPEGGSSGMLTTRDILGLQLDRTRLVVLASCETQAGRVSASEGSLNLAYAFLAAGVPAAVGSLWYVDDQSTARIFIRFHQELSRGADAISALRTAQLEELSTHPYENHWTWASFQVFGGVAAQGL